MSADLPATVDWATFQAKLDILRIREKAHTREGDAIPSGSRTLRRSRRWALMVRSEERLAGCGARLSAGSVSGRS